MPFLFRQYHELGEDEVLNAYRLSGWVNSCPWHGHILVGPDSKWLGRRVDLDRAELELTLSGFPGLFRKSKGKSGNDEYCYALQARYAQYKAKAGEEADQGADIPPIGIDKLKVLVDFVQKMAEHEQTNARAARSNWLLVVTAVFSAVTSIIVGAGYLKAGSPPQPTLVKVEFPESKQ